MTPADNPRPVPTWRLMLWPLIAGAVLAAAGYLPTRWLAGPSGVRAMLMAQAVVTAVVWATLWAALRSMARQDAPGRLRIALKVGTIRLVFTLVVIAVIAWRSGVEPTVFLVWSAIAYVVMVMLEAVALVRGSRRFDERAR